MTKQSDKRAPKNAHDAGSDFDVLLEKWRRGEDVAWSELFAAWVKAPAAPVSGDVVRRVIRKVEWIE
jgi:hypothetical protein